MQGQGSAIRSLPEILAFDHGSSSSDTSDISLNSTNQETQTLTMWSVGEASSSSVPNQLSQSHSEPLPEHEWPTLTTAYLEPHQHEPPAVDRKRKAIELSVGQSSSPIEKSNLFQRPEVTENPSDQIIPRLELGVGRVSSENNVVENTRRNVRLRINQDSSQANNNGQSNILLPDLRLNPVDLRAPPEATVAVNPSSHQGQSVSRAPVLRRNLQASSRWNRGSSSRANRSSNVIVSGDRDDFDSRTAPTNILDDPILVEPSEISNTGNGITGSSSGSTRNPSRRLTEFIRRSLLSFTNSEVGGGQNSNFSPGIPPAVGTSASSSSSQDGGIPPLVGSHGQHHHHHLDGASGLRHLSRTMDARGEGRGRLVSELRHVLDLMRRGEGLQFEDVMLLDRSFFHGVADFHDRHRDMRLDIDNMSYEELLALEERIGNVNTGLTEETILKCVKPKNHATIMGQPGVVPCCICQEEYKDGDDLGALECGHDFHKNCIKQWLLQKNLCPICKSTAFAL